MKKIMLAILLVLCVGVMTACSGNSGNTDAKASEYIFKKFELDKGKDIARCPFLNGNDFYYISYPDPDENDDAAWEELKENEYKGSVHRYKIDSGEDAVLFEIKNASDIESLYVTEQNQIKLLCRYYNEDAGVHALCTRTQDGAEIGLVSLTDNVNAALDGGGTIEEAYLERDGQIYLSCVGLESGKKIIVRCDMEGNVTGSVKLDDYIEYIDGVFLDNEKRPAVEANSDEGLTYMYLDFEKGECGETVAIQDEENKYKFSSKIHGGGLWSKIYDGHGNAACYVRDIAGLCSYNAAEQKITYLFDWLNSGIVGNNVYDIMPLEDGRFLCECFDGIEMAYGIIEELKDGKKRKIIKCAILDTENDCGHTLQYDIIHYNNINADYKVELISYENSSNPIDAFAKDVIAGNVPDVLDISGVDVESYIRQGFFEDLAPYMENDGEFGRDYYVDGLYDAIAEDGKQYYAVKSFRLDTIAARASDTEKYKDGWTIYDLIDYYNAKPEGTLLYDYDTNREIFKRLAAPFVDDYIDRDTGHVSFDSDEFRVLVEFCNSFPQSNELWSDYNDVKKMFSEGKIL
ncbi:MAG: extracellular solute-binding protein, partial [Lachnospiraceae bacterium]|nr:extracellular solute-binding protein [Lachnospiraceae bacterium]